MSKLIVAKFGGTSVADFDAMLRCADIVLSNPDIRVVVVSASSGVTNLLVDISRHTDVSERYACYQGIEKITLAVLNRLAQPDVVAAEIDQLLSALKELIEQGGAVYSAAHKDEIQSFGERLSSVLFAQVLRERGASSLCFDVRRVMRTDSRFGKGEPQIDSISQLCAVQLQPLLADNVIVTQGFIGADEAGQTTTLGRGGSDYSAALLGEALA
ncbi:MAG TPA: lysine-sensitive aspartokinase 3, partial [Rheinheimera sp.]|nr:lysine-sensitive aspartokinase 3 [Rheinheimera sp.]